MLLCHAGQLALGKSGQYLVAGFALSEFFGGGCMMLIVMWRIVQDTLPDQGDILFTMSVAHHAQGLQYMRFNSWSTEAVHCAIQQTVHLRVYCKRALSS